MTISFDAILKAVENDIGAYSNVISTIVTLAEHFAEDYMKDGSLRNGAIDALITYLQSLKC